MNIQHILLIVRKELALLLRDRAQLIVLFLMPLVFATFFGQMNRATWGEEEEESSIVFDVFLVNQDDGTMGDTITKRLKDTDILSVSEMASVDAAEQGVINSEALAAVVIPAGFSSSLEEFEPVTIEIIIDPIQEEYASQITGMMNWVVADLNLQTEIQYGVRTILGEAGVLGEAGPEMARAIEAQTVGVIMTQMMEMVLNPIISVQSEDMEGAQLTLFSDPFQLYMPAFTVMFVFFLMGTISTALWREKEEGSLRRLMAAPIGRESIIAGTMLAYMVVVLLQVGLLFGISNAIFAMNLGSSLLGLLVLTIALSFVATSLGMFIYAFSRSAKQADSLSVILALTLAGIGGAIPLGPVPFYRLGGFVGTLSQLTPHAHALEGYLKLMTENAALVNILPQVGLLVAYGAVLFVGAMLRFRLEW